MRNSELKKTMNLLQQALGSVQGNDRHVQEARGLIHKAIAKLDEAGERHADRKQSQETQAQKWWNKVVSGIAVPPMSKSAAMRSLEQLNKMTKEQNVTIDTIESEVEGSRMMMFKD